MLPETRYAKSGDVHIAYQVIGNGPFDLVFVPGFISHVERLGRAALGRLPGTARVILPFNLFRQARHGLIRSRFSYSNARRANG
jgi:hypothetical protein